MFFVCFPLLGACVYGNVIHVDCDVPFVDEIMEYSVHHSLKGSRGVG